MGIARADAAVLPGDAPSEDAIATFPNLGLTWDDLAWMREQLEPLRANALDDHPWRDWASAAAETSRMPANGGKRSRSG